MRSVAGKRQENGENLDLAKGFRGAGNGLQVRLTVIERGSQAVREGRTISVIGRNS